MPQKECCKMDQRLRFVAGLVEGEKMAPLCRSFGISRTTGHDDPDTGSLDFGVGCWGATARL